MIDSQSAKTALKRGGEATTRAKKIKGRKRHIAVDAEGNLLAVIVHSSGIQDRIAARAVRMRLFCRFDTLTTVFVDQLSLPQSTTLIGSRMLFAPEPARTSPRNT